MKLAEEFKEGWEAIYSTWDMVNGEWGPTAKFVTIVRAGEKRVRIRRAGEMV